MKKKKLALLLAAAMTVTSLDSTAMMVTAADFTSEEVQEQSVELTDEPSEAAEETDAETEDGGVLSENSSELPKNRKKQAKIPSSTFRKKIPLLRMCLEQRAKSLCRRMEIPVQESMKVRATLETEILKYLQQR